MPRKKLDEDQVASRSTSFNSLMKQLEHEDSLLNYLTPDIRVGVLSIPEELINLDEDVLLAKIAEPPYKYKPTNTTEALRNNFWLEFDRANASRNETLMNMTNVYLGVCTKAHWLNITSLPQEAHVLAYILTRPPQYEAVQAGLLSLSTRRIKEILSIPIYKANTELQDPKVIELILKASAMVDMRNKGGYLNRSETKNLTMLEQRSTVNITHGGIQNADQKNIQQLQSDIEEKLKALEQEVNDSPALPQPKITPAEKSDVVVEAEYKEVPSGE